MRPMALEAALEATERKENQDRREEEQVKRERGGERWVDDH